jgi:hypothetical protein
VAVRRETDGVLGEDVGVGGASCAIFLAGPAAACVLEQDSAQPVFRVSGHDKMVYAEACPRPERLAALCAAKPSQDACEAVALCQWAAGEKPGRQCRRACRTPNIQP